MIRQVMPEFRTKKNVVILCDSWYAKKDLVCVVNDYSNLDIICNARCDSVIYGLAPKPTGRKGRPAKHGRRLSIWDDFVLSDEKIGDYYTGVRRVLTNLFGTREVLAYVTSTEKDSGSRRLFFSTVFPGQLNVFCAWQEKAPLNQTGSRWMQYIPLFLYAFRWNIEVIKEKYIFFTHYEKHKDYTPMFITMEELKDYISKINDISTLNNFIYHQFTTFEIF